MRFLLDQDVPEAVCRVLRVAQHDSVLLRDVLPVDVADDAVLRFAGANELVLLTCNRDDFLSLAETHRHAGIVVLIRRRTRVAECAALFKLLSGAGEAGIRGNINFA